MKANQDLIWSNPKMYRDAAVVAEEASTELLSRLDWMKLTPSVILEVGCGTGELSHRLQKRFPNAKLLAVDASLPMITYTNETQTLNCLAADGRYLPLKKQSIDLIVANFFLPWQANVNLFLREWRRVLRAEGILLFNMLGLDTMQEWQAIIHPNDRPQFVDMHDIGDLLLEEGFADPVLDVNHYTTIYKNKTQLLNELQASGMWFSSDPVDETKMAQLPNQPLEVTYEVVYAHAFKVEKNVADDNGITNILFSDLRQQLKQSKQ